MCTLVISLSLSLSDSLLEYLDRSTLQLLAENPRVSGMALLFYEYCNREYFVKIFLDSLACAKIKRTKIHAQY